MTQRLSGKVAIVTGASKGIGASIALHFAAEGAAVVVNYSSSKEGAERVVNQIKQAGGKAEAIQADMSKHKDIQRLFSETHQHFGKLDILVNNAGIYTLVPIEDITPEDYYKMYDLNVFGLLFASQEAVKSFGEKGGNIINISSVVSTSYAESDMSLYCGSKGAVDAITRSLARELGPRKIRVNSINPGVIETEGIQAVGFLSDEKILAEIQQLTSLAPGYGQPKDVSQAAVFLASDDSSWITGESLYVSGGSY